MPVNIDEDNLKKGLLGLVVALVEIIQEMLERQAIRRIEGGRLSGEEIEKLGRALSDLNDALAKIKKENDLDDAVKSMRDGLDQAAEDMICKFLAPEQWAVEVKKA